MVNENGANYCAMQKVFGLDFVTSKVVSCQMHYKSNVYMVSSGLVQVTEIFSKVFVMKCFPLQP